MKKEYQLPTTDLLIKEDIDSKDRRMTSQKSYIENIEQAFQELGINVSEVKEKACKFNSLYEVLLEERATSRELRRFEDSLALKLNVGRVRIVSVSGRASIDIEIYNTSASVVDFREMLDSEEFRKAEGALCFALGKSSDGGRIIVDLKEMRHLLVAGMTGSGKDPCLHSILLSILFRAKPDEVKLILIDPGLVDLYRYNNLPHLLVPVVVDTERAVMALSYAVTITNDRLKIISEYNVKDLDEYNEKMRENSQYEKAMPQIVIAINELSHMMEEASSKTQELISRLAAKSSAAGIHMVVCTQRPKMKILSDAIRANIPSRIAFHVSSKAESRIILDKPGAERLQAHDDMLFSPMGIQPLHVQGVFLRSTDISNIIDAIKKQMGSDYCDDAMSHIVLPPIQTQGQLDEIDELFLPTLKMVLKEKCASPSMIQRHFRIGYYRAVGLLELMEEYGIVGPYGGTNRPSQLLMDEGEIRERYFG